MEREQLWIKLNDLQKNKRQIIPFNEIQKNLLENPSKFVAFLDGLFLRVSINRMRDLAIYYKTEKISESYFTMSNMELCWKMIHVNLNGTSEEYHAAFDYCKISEAKFKRDLEVGDAEQALEKLLDIAVIWNQDKEIVINSPEESQLESVAATVAETIEKEQEVTQISGGRNQAFISKLDVLRTSSQESVVHADSFGPFREYMHVKRPIESELERVLENVLQQEKPQLILLCGSVGDGKSHLLAYLKAEKPELTENVMIHNDSTESFNPEENSLDTLEYVLQHFDDDSSQRHGQHTVIAINLGVLHNFYNRQRNKGQFKALCEFIEQSGIFNSAKRTVQEHESFYMLNFAEEQPYQLTENGPQSSFFMDLMDKVTKPTNDNPFYNAWKSDIEQGYKTIAHENYRMLQNNTMKNSIIQSLIEAMIKQKIFISTRSFYNFLYEIIVPILFETDSMAESVSNVNDMLPNLMFAYPERSPLLGALHQIDPLKMRSKEIDRLNTDLVLSTSPKEFILETLGEEALVGVWKDVDKRFDREQKDYISLLIRHYALMSDQCYDKSYREFIRYIFTYYRGDASELGALFELISDVIYKWKGSPKKDYIYINSITDVFRLAVEIQIEPEIDESTFGSEGNEEISRFTPSVRLGFKQGQYRFLFELDYQLYVLLKKISKGYRPSWQELQDALQFSELHDQLIKSADKTKELYIVHSEDESMLRVKKQPRFEKTKYLVERVYERGL